MMEKSKKIMYSVFEKQVFKEIIAKYVPALYNDAVRGNKPEVREDRSKTWMSICEEFNSVHGVTQRSIKQLKKLLQNLKMEKREVQKVNWQNTFATEGGLSTPAEYPENNIIDNTNYLGHPIERSLDSDSKSELSLTHLVEVVGPIYSPVSNNLEPKFDGLEYGNESEDFDCPPPISGGQLPTSTKEEAGFTSNSRPPSDQQAGTSFSNPTISPIPLHRLTGTKRKQQLMADEFDARCKRVLQQTHQDSEAHRFLLEKLEHEARLAKVLAESAQVELEITKDRQKYERKKQEMELEFLEAKYRIQLDTLNCSHAVETSTTGRKC